MIQIMKSLIFLLLIAFVIITSSTTRTSAAINWGNKTFESYILRYDAASNSYFASSANSSTNQFPIIANMNINRTYNLTGWDILEISTNAEYLKNISINSNQTEIAKAYYGAGYLEAFYTFDTISDSWLNFGFAVQEQIESDPYNLQWVHDHLEYLRLNFNTSDSKNKNSLKEKHRYQVAKFLSWIEGLTAGYEAGRAKSISENIPGADQTVPPLNFTQFFLFQFLFEAGDVNQSNPKYSPNISKGEAPSCQNIVGGALDQPQSYNYQEHCSVLFKLTSDDLIATHLTWQYFIFLLRQYKTYTFEGMSVTQSGYPGTLASADDWYITGSKLVVTETTNNQFNTSLSAEFVRPNVVSEFLRVSTANYLATNSKEWVDLFLMENSGTYANQWMIMNMGQISEQDIKNGKLPKNTFWVVENLPGPYSGKADMTWFINENKFWPSFNRPYFKSVADITCNTYYHENFGPIWGYYDYARYEIFAREQHKVVDIESMKKISRYNDWQNDPLSVIPWCEGCEPKNAAALTISARYDLIPNTTFTANHSNASAAVQAYLEPILEAGIDAKITSWKQFQQSSTSSSSSNRFKVKSFIIDGPTNEQQPTFAWSNITLPPLPHFGQPDVFNFPWIEVESVLVVNNGNNNNSNNPPTRWTEAIIIAAISISVVFVVTVIVYKKVFSSSVKSGSGNDGEKEIQDTSNVVKV